MNSIQKSLAEIGENSYELGNEVSNLANNLANDIANMSCGECPDRAKPTGRVYLFCC